MKLVNRTQNSELAGHVRQAKTFAARSKGLLGERELPLGETLWIHRCPSIHTFFMAFTIDAIFVDRNLKVRAIYKNLRPWRMTPPILGASSVFELPAGTLESTPVHVGDQLYVGD